MTHPTQRSKITDARSLKAVPEGHYRFVFDATRGGTTVCLGYGEHGPHVGAGLCPVERTRGCIESTS